MWRLVLTFNLTESRAAWKMDLKECLSEMVLAKLIEVKYQMWVATFLWGGMQNCYKKKWAELKYLFISAFDSRCNVAINLSFLSSWLPVVMNFLSWWTVSPDYDIEHFSLTLFLSEYFITASRKRNLQNLLNIFIGFYFNV